MLVVAITSYDHVRILTARDRAVDFGRKLQEAMQQIKVADRQRLADMKKDYLQTAVIVGQTTNPDRRRVGLDFIRKAVALEPEPELRPQLRDEAVKFLVLRDVETRPELATSRASSLVFGRGGHRLGILSEDNEELAFWNVRRNQRLATFSLRSGSNLISAPAEATVTESLSGRPNGAGPGRRSVSRRDFGTRPDRCRGRCQHRRRLTRHASFPRPAHRSGGTLRRRPVAR